MHERNDPIQIIIKITIKPKYHSLRRRANLSRRKYECTTSEDQPVHNLEPQLKGSIQYFQNAVAHRWKSYRHGHISLNTYNQLEGIQIQDYPSLSQLIQ